MKKGNTVSLESKGSNFNVVVELNDQQKSSLTFHPSRELRQEKDLESFQISSPALGNDIESKRIAFLLAMWEFSNSPHFQAVTYNLQDEFEIKVRHVINLSMPTP